MTKPGTVRSSAHEAVRSLLARSGRPLKVGELVRSLRQQGFTDNPGGLLLRMVAEGDLMMDDDRRLLLADALMVA
ncbi:MAG TPA: hypothetical protein VFA11_17620 [Acidimicrobiales bacterium]|nr:hypothetical protein [Acidimicrobiales bacterium]